MFEFKPKQHLISINPIMDPIGFRTLWQKLKMTESWKNAKKLVIYVGSDNDYHYFQESENTNGFARVSIN